MFTVGVLGIIIVILALQLKNIKSEYSVVILLKIMGISYIAEFVSDIAKDSGYSALSNQIQIYGKITILVVSVPILESLINCINGLLL